MKYKHFSLFPTLVSVFDLKFCLTAEILDYLDNCEKTDHLLIKHGVSSYGGISKNLKSVGIFSQLFKQMQTCLDSYTEKAGIDNCLITESWYNVLHKQGEVLAHRHEGSVVSGAFYPIIFENSSNLFFESPLKVHKMNDIISKETEYSSYNLEFPVDTGILILFPSWLTHYVPKNNSLKRITISFNTIRVKDKIFLESCNV